MKKLLTVLKVLNPRKILTIFLAGMVLLVTTACNPASYNQGADADKNLPVQVGGQNNPYKGGGDSILNTKTMNKPGNTEKPSPAQADQAALPLPANYLIAATLDSQDNQSKLLYPGSEKLNTPKRINELEAAAEETAEATQPVLIQTDPKANLLEKTQKQFQDASKFIGKKTGEALQRPEMQANPTQQ